MASHVYNAWLVQLIHQGRAPGLWVENIWQNVFFDSLLTHLAALFGLGLAEKVAVALAVLLFFWSLFAFVSAVSGEAPWTLIPVFAMLAYGWTFQVGFFNYYIAIALSFLALSVVWAERGYRRLFSLTLVPLIFLAHPLGLLWFFAAALYILLAERLPPRGQFFLLAISGLLLWLVHKYMWSHFKVAGPAKRIYTIVGIDQLVLYGYRYWLLAGALLLIVMAILVVDVMQRRNEKEYWSRLSILLQLYIAVELGVLLLPSLVFLPKYPGALALLVERLSLVSAILLLGLLGVFKQRPWHAVGFGACACVFFIFLYQDTAVLNGMEEQVERMVSTLPSGTRVMASIFKPLHTPIYFPAHMVDRACIERCFSYGNYEPSSGQFRIRALPGNGIVTVSPFDGGAMQRGVYIVKPEDLPAFQIYQCTPSFTELCIRELQAGERNDRLGVHPGQ
ncbi:MAG: hypothetical protein WCD43_05195 [Candidatus Acidiferrales bacterium]